MKKLLAALVLAFALAGAAYGAETCSKTNDDKNGELPACLALDAVTGDGSSAIIDVFGFKFYSVYVWSDQAPGVTHARVLIECRSYSPKANKYTPFLPCAEDVVDPDDNSTKTRSDQAITLSRSYQYRITVINYSAGDVSAMFERFNQ